MKKLISVLIIMCLSCVVGFSQTAVYFCPNTGAVGYAVNHKKFITKGYKECVKMGGTNPKLVIQSTTSGYGAIAIGYASDGGRVIGVALSCGSQAIAEASARKQCVNLGGNNVYILRSFYDFGAK